MRQRPQPRWGYPKKLVKGLITSVKQILRRPADVPKVMKLREPTRPDPSPSNLRTLDGIRGIFQRPFRPIVDLLRTNTELLMARQDYRVHSFLGLTTKSMSCKLAVLDTGAGSSFIKQDILPKTLLDKVQPLPGQTDVRDASN